MARRRSGKKIDFTHWFASTGGAAAQAAGTVGVNMLAAQHLPETLLRTRGEWAVTADGVQAPSVACVVTAGLILVPEGTGSTVLWSPQTDSDAPWFWWDTMHVIYDEYVTDGNYSSETVSGRRVIDSKAMRIIKNSEIQLVVENTTLIGGVTVNALTNMRFLFGT